MPITSTPHARYSSDSARVEKAEADVRGHPVAEERGLPVHRAIDELVDEDDVAGPDLFPHGTDGRCGEDPLDAQALQRVNIGPVVDFGRQQTMPPAVPCQKRRRAPYQGTDENVVRGAAERSVDPHLGSSLEPSQLVESTAADEGDAGMGVIGLGITHRLHPDLGLTAAEFL
jgi:hypothetical protein